MNWESLINGDSNPTFWAFVTPDHCMWSRWPWDLDSTLAMPDTWHESVPVLYWTGAARIRIDDLAVESFVWSPFSSLQKLCSSWSWYWFARCSLLAPGFDTALNSKCEFPNSSAAFLNPWPISREFWEPDLPSDSQCFDFTAAWRAEACWS